MTDLVKAARFLSPDTIPVSVGILPACWMKYGEKLQAVVDKYPQFFGGFKYDPATYAYSDTYHRGTHVDEWGCVWENVDEGMEAIVKGHPVKCEDDVYSLEIPQNRDGRLPHGFMYLRLLDLCGFELAMTMFAEDDEDDEEPSAIDVLIAKVLEYNEYQVRSVLPRLGDVIYFGDDLGMQRGLAVGAKRWRRLIKPCFAKLYGIVRENCPDTMIYMHTDGCIHEIIPDLRECGVEMVNPQYRANGLDNLVRVCRDENKIALNLDLDRQLFPFATPGELERHVAECVKAMYLPEGGFGINIEVNYEVPLENIDALFAAAEKYRHYKG